MNRQADDTYSTAPSRPRERLSLIEWCTPIGTPTHHEQRQTMENTLFVDLGYLQANLEQPGTATNLPARTQNPVRATSCGFESHLRHYVNLLQKQRKLRPQKKPLNISIGGDGSSRAAVD